MKTGSLIAIVIWSCLSVSTAFAKTADRKPIDEETGLVIDRGFETVKTNCTICHSAKFILRQKGDRQTWTDIIRWMQATQGLWQFDAKTEDLILDYLSNNYAPTKQYRRAPIPSSLMPPPEN